MKEMNSNIYVAPEVQVELITFENVLCLSGDIEGITEEDWDW